MQQFSETEIIQACRILFGSELQLSREFLSYLQPSGARSAYRQRAKLTHPDRFASSSSSIRARQEKLFQHLNRAHELVQSYLRQRSAAPADPHSQVRTGRTARPAAGRPATGGGRLYRGPLPARPLQLGQFLYYRGLIPYAAVIAAITWQRQQRPTLGEIARRWRWLDEKDIERILQTRSGFSRFGERAERLGLLNPLQVRTLLFHQRSRQQQIGRYFIEHNQITESMLDRLLSELSEHNLRYRHSFS